jgi:hypothetical protein
MTNSRDTTHADPTASDEQASTVPIVDTVVRTHEIEAGRATAHSVERTKTGRGRVVAIVVVPVLLALAIIFGYWLFAMAKANSESQALNHTSPAPVAWLTCKTHDVATRAAVPYLTSRVGTRPR